MNSKLWWTLASAVLGALLMGIGLFAFSANPAADAAHPQPSSSSQIELDEMGKETLAKGRVVIGMTEEAAQRKIESLGLIWRVVHRDGEPLAITMDLRMNRVNGYIDDGKVTKVEVY